MKAVFLMFCLLALSADAGQRTGARAEEATGNAAPLSLWYRQPAGKWLEALPIGNGRLGAMVFGGVSGERLALNESTLWSGAPSANNHKTVAPETLARIRRLLFDGKYTEARNLCQGLTGNKDSYGTHLPLADLQLDFGNLPESVEDYRRELDLDQAIARVSFVAGGVRMSRETFASNPDQVMVLRLTTDRPGALKFALRLHNPYTPQSLLRAENDHTLVMTGRAWENAHSDGRTGVAFETRVRVLTGQGSVKAAGDHLEISGADAATILIAAHTTFGGNDPAALCRKHIHSAAGKSYDALRAAHVTDHQRLFQRVALDLGAGATAGLPTDERLAALKESGGDPGLCALFFQYGRYLMIAGSRQNSPLPLNLQGLWNDNICCRMAWTCDFHLDVNQQQNYWPAQVANLSDCAEPQFKLIELLRQSGCQTAKAVYGARGWVAHTVTNPWGYTAPGWDLGWGIYPTAGIWLADDLWQHYQFTGDRNFLAQRAYPVLKEAAEFFLDYLVEDPRHGWLVTGPSVSPENFFRAPGGGVFAEDMGPVADTVLVRNLFTACVESARVLGVDAELRGKLEAARNKLQPLAVGKHGQLQEWRLDYDEAIPNHRHASHLVALYPCGQISSRRTPELAKAVQTTIERRLAAPGFEDTEFTRAMFLTFFARLGQAEKAYEQLLGLLGENTSGNLLCYSRAGIAGAPSDIFILDGNMAGAAGIAELLLQSHAGEIELLPALPKAWPDGAVKGLKARGNITVDIEWKDARVTSFKLRSPDPREVKVRVDGEVQTILPSNP